VESGHQKPTTSTVSTGKEPNGSSNISTAKKANVYNSITNDMNLMSSSQSLSEQPTHPISSLSPYHNK